MQKSELIINENTLSNVSKHFYTRLLERSNSTIEEFNKSIKEDKLHLVFKGFNYIANSLECHYIYVDIDGKMKIVINRDGIWITMLTSKMYHKSSRRSATFNTHICTIKSKKWYKEEYQSNKSLSY